MMFTKYVAEMYNPQIINEYQPRDICFSKCYSKNKKKEQLQFTGKKKELLPLFFKLKYYYCIVLENMYLYFYSKARKLENSCE